MPIFFWETLPGIYREKILPFNEQTIFLNICSQGNIPLLGKELSR
jgi:hypothetical protein